MKAKTATTYQIIILVIQIISIAAICYAQQEIKRKAFFEGWNAGMNHASRLEEESKGYKMEPPLATPTYLWSDDLAGDLK